MFDLPLVISRKTVTAILVLLTVIFFSGCESIPIPMPKMKTSKATYKTRDFPISRKLPFRAVVKSKDDLIGDVIFDKKLYDGYEYGNITCRPGAGKPFQIHKCWEEKIVDLTQITWPNGESWLLLVWDHGKQGCLRTISLLDPRIQEMFSLELTFAKPEDPGANNVKYRVSWKMSLPNYGKYLDFLEKVKVQYSDPRTWGSETRGKWFKPFPGLASMTFQMSNDYLADNFVGPSDSK